MTYSTCTINPEENEAIVRYALDTYPCLRLVPAEPRVGGPGLWGGKNGNRLTDSIRCISFFGVAPC